MYRQTDDRKVWYEWMVEVFRLEEKIPSPATMASSQQNATSTMMSGGIKAAPTTASGKKLGASRRIRVGMSEMHSSIKDGCLM